MASPVANGPLKGYLNGGERSSGKHALIPPEDAEIFVHGPGVSELVHDPHDAGGSELVGVVSIEIESRGNVGAGREGVGNVGGHGGFEEVEIEDACLLHDDGYGVHARRYGGAQEAPRDYGIAGVQVAIQGGLRYRYRE